MRLLLALILFASSISLQAKDKFDSPSSKSWEPLKIGLHGAPSTFAGKVEISGVFLFTWIDHPESPELRLMFQPSKNVKDIIPVFIDFPAPKDIEIRYPEKVIKMFTSEYKIAEGLQSGKIKSFGGEATILVENMFSAVDCDHRSYIFDLVSVKNIKKAEHPIKIYNEGC
jgi:hypothetical protein